MLSYEKYLYPCLLVQKRLEVIHLRALTQLTNQEIAHLAGVHRDTVTDYIRCYNEQGLAGLKAVGYQGPVSQLNQHQQSLQQSFQEQPPLVAMKPWIALKILLALSAVPLRYAAG